MWDAFQINRTFWRAIREQNNILFMAAQVATHNAQVYGPLSPAQIEAIKKSWGEE
jgi:hypothetical protein